MELIYHNCREYNGEESEYYELAEEMRRLFRALVREHIEGETPDDDSDDAKGKRRKRESRSASECLTPEFSSESSSEEESDGNARQVVSQCVLHESYISSQICT